MKSAVRFSQPGSDIKGSWLLPPITEQERASCLASPRPAGSAAIPRARARGQKPPDRAQMPKSSSSCWSQARFAGSLPHSHVGFHLGLLEQSEISVDKDLPTDVLLNQTTHQFQGNQTATETRGSLAQMKKIATFSHGGEKDCFCCSDPVCSGPSWDMAQMYSKDRIFMSTIISTAKSQTRTKLAMALERHQSPLGKWDGLFLLPCHISRQTQLFQICSGSTSFLILLESAL